MLTDEEKANNKSRYCELLKQAVPNADSLISFLDGIGYFDAPATAQYNGAYSGGLCEYALKLAHELGVLCHHYKPGAYSAVDVLRVALLKEAYRAQMYELSRKNVKNDETGQWESVCFYKTKENRPFYGDLGFSSYMMLRSYVDFTDEQIEAIIHSTGLNSYSADIHDVLKSYPLVTLTRMADLAVNNIIGDKA